ncbi:MAG TPA: cyclase family protein [Micromonosporaceae bacterium]
MCLAGTTAHAHDHSHDHNHAGQISRRALFAGGAAAALLAAMPAPAQAAGRNIADLTHTLTAGFPVYGLDAPAKQTVLTIPEHGVYVQNWTFGEHSGTHIDVPGHFRTGGRLLPQITPAELVLPVAVVDISARVPSNPDTQVTVADVQQYESTHGRIPQGAVVFMYSGWESRLPLGAAAYRGEDANGVFHFPGWSAAAVEWLLDRRGVSCVGVDTLSLDPGPSTTLDVHHMLLGDADRIGLENVARLATIPPAGAALTIGAIPLEDGSGGPCRLLAGW